MPELDEIAYMCANVVAAAKEKAIMEAFNHHFGRSDWTESDVSELELESITDLSVGLETLSINGVPVLEFSLMRCHVDIETGMVQCLYAQDIKQLYGCCGVG